MEFAFVVVALVALVALGIIAPIAHRNGSKAGAKKVADGIIRGASFELGRSSQEELALAISRIARNSWAETAQADRIERTAIEIGQEIAAANVRHGLNAQTKGSLPKVGEAQLVISLRHLHWIERMANFGFRQMLRQETDSPWRITTREDAYEAAAGLDSLSRQVGPQANDDEIMRRLRIDASGDRQSTIAFTFARDARTTK